MEFQLVFIGGGTAACAGVAEALALGADRIAVIEREAHLGGRTLHACLPMHAMMEAAHLFHEFRQGDALGIDVLPLQLDFAALMRKTESILEQGTENPFQNDARVSVIQGHARFSAPHEITVQDDSRTRMLTAENIVIATGAQPHIPEIEGLVETGYIRPDEASRLTGLPSSLAVIGGGKRGVEFAQLFQKLGCRVSLIENRERLLNREDADAACIIEKRLREDGVTLHLGTEIINVHPAKDKRGKRLKRLNMLDAQREPVSLEVEQVLLAAGQRGAPADLNIDVADIASDAHGVIINDHCQTTTPHIWAVGDVTGPYHFKHAADYQAVVAVRNIMGLTDSRLNYAAMPVVYYTDPPLARIGLTESQAKENFESVIVLRETEAVLNPLEPTGSLTGFCKVLVDGDTEQILGAHLVDAEADYGIHLFALAMQAGIPVSEMMRMVYAYPSRARLIERTVAAYRFIGQKEQPQTDSARHGKEKTAAHPFDPLPETGIG